MFALNILFEAKSMLNINKTVMKKVTITMMILVCIALSSFAQFKVSGTVTNASDGYPMPGVNVIIKGTTLGTVTDLDGNYSIEVNDSLNAILAFSSIGMISENRGCEPNHYRYSNG